MSEQANLLRQIADEIERGGNYWERFELRSGFDGRWYIAGDEINLFVRARHDPQNVRLKPRTITGPGGTYEYPEPMREIPPLGTSFAVPYLTVTGGALTGKWEGDYLDLLNFNRNLCFRAKEDARQCARALILAGGGTLEEEE